MNVNDLLKFVSFINIRHTHYSLPVISFFYETIFNNQLLDFHIINYDSSKITLTNYQLSNSFIIR